MTVVSAVDRQLADLGATELARLMATWNQGQQRWAELSTATQVVPVERTSHHIEIDRPDVVIDAVAGLLAYPPVGQHTAIRVRWGSGASEPALDG